MEISRIFIIGILVGIIISLIGIIITLLQQWDSESFWIGVGMILGGIGIVILFILSKKKF